MSMWLSMSASIELPAFLGYNPSRFGYLIPLIASRKYFEFPGTLLFFSYHVDLGLNPRVCIFAPICWPTIGIGCWFWCHVTDHRTPIYAAPLLASIIIRTATFQHREVYRFRILP